MNLLQRLAGQSRRTIFEAYRSYSSSGEGSSSFKINTITALRLGASVILFIIAVSIPEIPAGVKIFLSIAAMLISGYEVLLHAVSSALGGHMLDEHVWTCTACIASFFLGRGHEGAMVMILYRSAGIISSFVLEKGRQTVQSLVCINIDKTAVIAQGRERSVDTESVKPGSFIHIRPGDMVPLDCIITQGRTAIDVSLLTGDTEPVPVGEDEYMPAGAINLSSPVKAEVTATKEQSAPARILNTLSSGSDQPSGTERRIQKMARVYTPAMLITALITGAVSMIFFKLDFASAIYRSLIIAIASGSGALLQPIPLVYLAGIGGGAVQGVLFKNKKICDMTMRVKSVIFDKTGTLTTGNYRVVAVKSERLEAELLLKIAAHAEAMSSHPIGKAIVAAYGGEIYIEIIESFKEHKGIGITVKVEGAMINIGSHAFLRSLDIDVQDDINQLTTVYIAVNGAYAGRIILADGVRDGASAAAGYFVEMCGKRNVSMLSGDSVGKCRDLAEQLGISEYFAQCSEDDKLLKILETKRRIGKRNVLAVVVNRSNLNLLENADVGICVSGLYEKDSLDSADIVMIDERPLKLMTAVQAAQGMYRILVENVLIVFAVKFLIMALGTAGAANLIAAMLLNLLVSAAVILNALRAFKIKE